MIGEFLLELTILLEFLHEDHSRPHDRAKAVTFPTFQLCSKIPLAVRAMFDDRAVVDTDRTSILSEFRSIISWMNELRSRPRISTKSFNEQQFLFPSNRKFVGLGPMRVDVRNNPLLGR